MVHTYNYKTNQDAYKHIVEDLLASPIVNNTHEINNCFFTVENPKTGSAIISIIPKILTAISGSSHPITLAPASINVATPIVSKLIDHIALTFFESIFLPPQIQIC